MVAGSVRPHDRSWLAFIPCARYSYLLRLHRFGLLERRSSSGSILYAISVKGIL
jgi:hypothetical protein